MIRFVAARLIQLAPILLGVSVLIFVMPRLGPGDPALDYLRLSQIPPTDQAIAEARIMLGLDRPLVEQYLSWLYAALHGDFGISYATRRPVLQDVLIFLPATLELAAVAFAITIGFSIPLGMIAAGRRDRWPDHVVRAVSFLGVSAPNFWIAFLLIFLFAAQLGWLPPFGRGGWQQVIMPALAVAVMSLSVNARLLRAAMLEQAGQRHVAWARMRGLPEAAIQRRHVLRNALVPVVAASGMHLGELIGGAMVIENVFAWPGLGRYAVAAIYARDYPVLQCFTLMMTLLFVLLNLTVDLIHAWLDPRIRLGQAEGSPA